MADIYDSDEIIPNLQSSTFREDGIRMVVQDVARLGKTSKGREHLKEIMSGVKDGLSHGKSKHSFEFEIDDEGRAMMKFDNEVIFNTGPKKKSDQAHGWAESYKNIKDYQP